MTRPGTPGEDRCNGPCSLPRSGVTHAGRRRVLALCGERFNPAAGAAAVLTILAQRRFDADSPASTADRAFWHAAIDAMDPGPSALASVSHPLAPAGLGRRQATLARSTISLDLSSLAGAGMTRSRQEGLLLTAYGLALCDVAQAKGVVVARRIAASERTASLAGPFTAEMAVPPGHPDRGQPAMNWLTSAATSRPPRITTTSMSSRSSRRFGAIIVESRQRGTSSRLRLR